MEKFGHVEVANTGNRNNQKHEPPFVRFGSAFACDKAMEAINAGKVTLDGQVLKAEKKVGGRAPPPPRKKEGAFKYAVREKDWRSPVEILQNKLAVAIAAAAAEAVMAELGVTKGVTIEVEIGVEVEKGVSMGVMGVL